MEATAIQSILNLGVAGVCLLALYQASEKKDSTQYQDNKEDKEKLYSVIKESNALNERLQSSNEDLVASNNVLVETNSTLVKDMSSKVDKVLTKLDTITDDRVSTR